MKKFCSSKLQNFKVPVKVTIVDKVQYSDRFKKNRSNEDYQPKQ